MITIIIDNTLREAGIAAAATAYNAALPTPAEGESAATLTPEQYMQMIVDGAADSYIKQFNVGSVSSGDFVLRFTSQEFYDINTAAQTDPHIEGFLARVREIGSVSLYSASVIGAMQYLVEKALVTQERAAEILTWAAPTPAPAPEPAPEPEPEPTPEPAPEPSNG